MSRFLVDVNVLFSYGTEDHPHYSAVTRWIDSLTTDTWGTCAFTQAGFLRLMSHPAVGGATLISAERVLASMTDHPRHLYWPILEDWRGISTGFNQRIFGHQQITDAWLLGLAVREGGVVVTFDRGLQTMAGERYRHHVLLLG